MAALGVGRVGPALAVGQVCSAQPLGRAVRPSPSSESPYKLSQHCLGHSPLRWPALFSSRLAATWSAAAQRTLELHDCPWPVLRGLGCPVPLPTELSACFWLKALWPFWVKYSEHLSLCHFSCNILTARQQWGAFLVFTFCSIFKGNASVDCSKNTAVGPAVWLKHLICPDCFITECRTPFLWAVCIKAHTWNTLFITEVFSKH